MISWKMLVVLMLVVGSYHRSAAGAETFAIISLNLDGTDVALLAEDPKQNYGSVDVSNDGKMIAFDAWPLPTFVNTKQWIIVAKVDGKNKRKVIKGGMPKWSPDDKLIAFQDYVNGVAVAQPDGGGRELVSPENGSPSWIQGGNGLAVLEWGRNIQVVDLIEGGFRRLDKNGIPGILWGFAVSKDGKKVCYSQRTPREGIYKIVVTDLDGSTIPKTLHTGEVVTGFGWHPDGKRIIFAEGEKASQVFILDIETGKTVKVPGDKNESYVNPCFSRDGKRIFCSSTIRPGK